MHSQLIHMARTLGATGLWLPPARGVCIDVSGYGRHAYGDGNGGVPYAVRTPDVAPPAWDGPTTGTANPYSATIPAIGEAHTLMAYVNIPTTSEHGAFVMLSSGGSRGLGFGVGNGSVMEVAGNTLMTLNETIAWHSTGYALGTGWRLVIMSSVNGASLHKTWVDGTLVSTLTRAALLGGTVTNVRVGGYYNSVDRVFSGGLSVSGWWDRNLSDGECIALSRAARHHRAAA